MYLSDKGDRTAVELPMNNQTIIEGFLHNQKDVILVCYQRLLPIVQNMVKKNGGDEDDARNVIWKAFTVFRKNCKKEDFTLKNFDAYVYRTARFLWYQEIEKRRKDVITREYTQDFMEEGIRVVETLKESLQDGEKEDTIKGFQQHLKDLPLICQQMIRLKYQFDLPHTDIGIRLGISTVNSRQRLSRCLRELADMIDKKNLTQELKQHYPGVITYLQKYLKK